MKILSALILTVFLLTLIQCGGSKLEEGDAFVADGKYTQGINSYLAYKKSNPDATGIDNKIALASFNKGKDLYNRSRNIQSFAGNYDKSQEYIDENTMTGEQKGEYSSLLYDLAIAYRSTRPNNDIEEEQYFNNTLNYLQLAVDYNPQNTTADSMISYIYMENFQEMFDKGVKAYNQAKKVRNNIDLYLSAEYYFEKAVQFNSSHEEAAKYLSNTRKETLGILENIQPFSFCVPTYKIDKNKCYIAVAAKNYSNDPIAMDIKSLTLNTTDGKVIPVDLKKTAELEKALNEKTEIKPYDLIEGQVVYALEPGTDLEYIAYSVDDNRTVKKYFP
jgi:hypothetical protein